MNDFSNPNHPGQDGPINGVNGDVIQRMLARRRKTNTTVTPVNEVREGDKIQWVEDDQLKGGFVTGIVKAGSAGVSANGKARLVARVGFLVDGKLGPAFDLDGTQTVEVVR